MAAFIASRADDLIAELRPQVYNYMLINHIGLIADVCTHIKTWFLAVIIGTAELSVTACEHLRMKIITVSTYNNHGDDYFWLHTANKILPDFYSGRLTIRGYSNNKLSIGIHNNFIRHIIDNDEILLTIARDYVRRKKSPGERWAYYM